MRSSLLPSVSASLLALTALSVPASAQSRDGWTYTTITTDSGNAGSRISRKVRYRMAGTAYRTDDLLSTLEGEYEIVNRTDTTLALVMPLTHVVMVWSRSSFPKPSNSPLPSFVRHLTKNEFEDLGTGEKILGHATRHVRVTKIGTLETRLMGQTCTQPLDDVTETWVAPDVDLPPADANPFASIRGLDSIAGQSAGKPMPKGAALRTIWRSVVPDSTGKLKTVTTTSEVVELTFGPLDASIFAVPADFDTMDMPRWAEVMDSTDVATRTPSSFCPGGWRPRSPQ